jgi:hypothetical protein
MNAPPGTQTIPLGPVTPSPITAPLNWPAEEKLLKYFALSSPAALATPVASNPEISARRFMVFPNFCRNVPQSVWTYGEFTEYPAWLSDVVDLKR